MTSRDAYPMILFDVLEKRADLGRSVELVLLSLQSENAAL